MTLILNLKYTSNLKYSKLAITNLLFQQQSKTKRNCNCFVSQQYLFQARGLQCHTLT